MNKLIINAINLLFLFFLSCTNLQASQIVSTGTASGMSKGEACDLAMVQAKKEALEKLGVEVRSEVNIVKSVNNGDVTLYRDSIVKQQSRATVKVINKVIKTNYNDSTGLIICTLTANLTVVLNKITDVSKNKLSNEKADTQREFKIEGGYTVHGTNPNGTNYKGRVVIRRENDIFKIKWKIGSSTFNGEGQLSGDVLTINWGQSYPVIYVVTSKGILDGIWGNGAGKEILTPE